MMIFILAAALLAFGLLEPFFVQKRRDVLKGPKSLAGLKIAFLSDLHCKGAFSLFRAERALRRLQKERPDVLILGGDYADEPEWAKNALTLAAAFSAPLGVFAVRGNHDYYYNLDRVLKDLPVKLLDNEGVLLPCGGGKLLLSGLVDYNRDTPDATSALKKRQQADMTVLIAHNPRCLANVPQHGADFALCGHTHGGQITIFGLYSPLADRPLPGFSSQWLNRNGIPTLYSNGVGTTFLPLRFMAPPQIHIIEIRENG